MQVEGFRYRAEDSLRRVTRLAIKRARVRELEAELLNSAVLKEHFENNPQVFILKALRHDRALHPYADVCCVYADVCWRMLTYADRHDLKALRHDRALSSHADVCWRMLTYAGVC
jgi:hypothetical protein